MEEILQVRDITMRFGSKKTVLDRVNLSFEKGGIYGVIGNNGAGKTTLLKIILGLLKSTCGEIVYGEGENGKRIRMGALIENPGLYKDMSAYENIKAKALCLGIKYKKSEIDALLELVGLGDVGKKRTRAFSMGMKQRLGVALALVGDPDLLVLDEPINGLDPQGIHDIRVLIARIQEEKKTTMIISSHILDELAKTATHFCVIHRGKVIKNCPKEEFMLECGDRDINEYYLSLISGQSEPEKEVNG